MKEKFSELYHLAWNYSEFDDEYKENPTYERRCVVQSRIFAELIVRECSQAVLQVPCYHIDYRAQIEEAVINDCARAVLEHFGME